MFKNKFSTEFKVHAIMLDAVFKQVVSECALFSMEVRASSSNRSLKGWGRLIRRFCNRAHVLSGCFRSLSRPALDIVDDDFAEIVAR